MNSSVTAGARAEVWRATAVENLGIVGARNHRLLDKSRIFTSTLQWAHLNLLDRFGCNDVYDWSLDRNGSDKAQGEEYEKNAYQFRFA